MRTTISQHPSSFRRAALASAVAGALSLTAAIGFAGECPADKRVSDGQGQKMSTAAAKGVTDVLRATTDLSKEPAAIPGRQFRLRQLDL
ncbi:MAG TPA: hypothetical protein VL742_07870 [Casimicrobiaceae bacterium]|nr:hypothetical protein [Casimicrobiaceae bacterium]